MPSIRPESELRRFIVSLAATLVSVASGAPSAHAQSRPHLVQSVDLQVPVAPVPVTIAGKTHLAYELRVTNFRPVEVTLVRVEILDAGRNKVIAELSDSALSRSIGHPGMSATVNDARDLGAGTHAVVYFWLALEPSAPFPAQLKHRVHVDVKLPSGTERVVVETEALDASKQTPPVLAAPLRGGPWVALYDPKMMGGHRTSIYTLDGRARIPARFAIDWVRLESDATHARGDQSQIANWYGYGAEVLAVANATVAEAVHDLPEAPALTNESKSMPLENASGNYVTLDLGNGRYAFYEHLKHGSVRVKAGEKVKRGQVIGLLGNSGSSSSGPHLHFHVADASAELAAEGMPYVLEQFEVIGAFDAIGDFATGAHWQVAPAAARGLRGMELPAANAVVMFK